MQSSPLSHDAAASAAPATLRQFSVIHEQVDRFKHKSRLDGIRDDFDIVQTFDQCPVVYAEDMSGRVNHGTAIGAVPFRVGFLELPQLVALRGMIVLSRLQERIVELDRECRRLLGRRNR